MSHHKDSAGLVELFKFQDTLDDFYTVTHNIGDTRPAVEVYNDFTNIKLGESDMVVTVVNSNTITITLLAGAQPIRGTVIGAPDPGE